MLQQNARQTKSFNIDWLAAHTLQKLISTSYIQRKLQKYWLHNKYANSKYAVIVITYHIMTVSLRRSPHPTWTPMGRWILRKDRLIVTRNVSRERKGSEEIALSTCKLFSAGVIVSVFLLKASCKLSGGAEFELLDCWWGWLVAGLWSVFSFTTWGHRARSDVETFDSLPLGNRTLAKLGLTSSNSTSSASGSLLLLTNCRKTTRSDCISHDGKDFPIILFDNPKNRSCGVKLVAVQSSDSTACRASGRSASQ